MIFATDLDRTIIHSSKFVDNASQVKCIEILDDKEISFSVYSEQSKNDVKEALRNIYWNNKIVQICKNAEQDFLNWLDENKFSYLYISQDIESFSKLFTNQVKSQNFLR